jgi:GNAT superfamily N-acetyltransferase
MKLKPETIGDYTYAIERISENVDEVESLWESHWAETESKYLPDTFDPDTTGVLHYESVGAILEFTIRYEENMVGHLGYYIGPNVHVRGTRIAKEDWFYITPEHRGGELARNLLSYAEGVLYKLGVTYIGMSDKSPIGGKSLEKLMTSQGYAPIAIHYFKEVRPDVLQ